MAGISLQFDGVENATLLAMVGVAIAVALLAYGLWQVTFGGRRRIGVAALSAGAATGACVLLAALRVPAAETLQQLLWLVLIGGAVAVAVGVFYAAVYAYLGPARVTALLVLRFLGIAALLLILFKPALSYQPTGDAARPVLAVLVDRSGSMDAVDHADLPNRYQQATEALSAQRRRLENDFRVRWMHFAAEARKVTSPEELAELSPSGPGTDRTDLAGAVRRAAGESAGDDLAAVVVISDGLHNAAGDAVDAARVCPAPIYALGVGGDEDAAGRRNLQLAAVAAPLEAVRNNVATITATVRLTGWANLPANVILSEGGRRIDSRQVIAPGNTGTVDVAFSWTPADPDSPANPDIRTLRVAVEPNPAESDPRDNAAELHVLITQPGIRVLYVEGTLRPEYKYLRRILATDPNVKLMSLVRMSTNNFLAQGSVDGRQLAALPQTDEQFGLFDVLILGDLDRTFLSREQMDRIRQFVNDGGGLLMLGGQNSFGPGGYGGTPVEAALPVEVGPRSAPQETTRFIPQLTPAGLTSPVLAGLEEFFHTPDRQAVKPLPELTGCVTVERARPGAQVLAIHPTRRNAAGPVIVLAIQNFGAGRSAAFTADTTWRWYLRLESLGADSPYHRFWGQLIRYLAGVDKDEKAKASSVLGRIDRAFCTAGETLTLTAQVRDAEGRPAADAAVTATLAGKDGAPVEVPLAASATATGLYEARHAPARSGQFTVTFAAADKARAPLGQDRLDLTVADKSPETDRLARDAATLQALAKASGGRYADLAELPGVVGELIDRRRAAAAPTVPPRHYNLYNFTALFLVFVALLSAEWLLRRRWQLQ